MLFDEPKVVLVPLYFLPELRLIAVFEVGHVPRVADHVVPSAMVLAVHNAKFTGLLVEVEKVYLSETCGVHGRPRPHLRAQSCNVPGVLDLVSFQ
jgi:hypothetical protein